MLLQVRGYHWAGYVVALLAGAGELCFYVFSMRSAGRVDSVASLAMISALLMIVSNAAHCWGKAFKLKSRPLTAETNIEEIHITGVNYLRVKGLEMLAKAQEKIEGRKVRVIKKERSTRELSKTIVENVSRECFTVHLLIGVVPICSSATVSCFRYGFGEERDTMMSFLAACTIYSKFIGILSIAQVAFSIRLSQVRRTASARVGGAYLLHSPLFTPPPLARRC